MAHIVEHLGVDNCPAPCARSPPPANTRANPKGLGMVRAARNPRGSRQLLNHDPLHLCLSHIIEMAQ